MRDPQRGTIDGLSAFMDAISAVESGHNYDAVGPYTGSTYGRARGRYQIMETIYGAWAREAGYAPDDFSPAAQDAIARKKMSDYYARYGSWDLVAVAWFAGPAKADKAKRAGISSVGGASDMLGTSVSTYVSKVMGGMTDLRDPGTAKAGRDMPRNARMDQAAAPMADRPIDPTRGRRSTIAPLQAAPGTVLTDIQQQTRDDQINQETMGSIMSFISDQAKGQGGRVLDARKLLGMPPVEQPLVEGLPDPSIGVNEPPAPSQPQQQQPETPRQADGPMAEPPDHYGFAGLVEGAQTGSRRLLAQFPGLVFTSGHRSAEGNAKAGGVKTSKHLTGEASDFDGSEGEMQAAAEWALANGAVKAFVHQDGDGVGRHLHIEWA